MTENVQLFIAKGIPPVTGDTGSLESVDTVLDLMSTRGFGVGEMGWTPQLPQLKDGGVYLDNPTFPDHYPLSLVLGQVQETITLSASGSSFDGRYFFENKLLRLAAAARDFWLTDTQTKPVYLAWKAPGSKGLQYALIYNIDFARIGDSLQPANPAQMTITIDREHGWTPIPPGDNPKHWSHIAAGTESTWNTTNSKLYDSNGTHISAVTIYNKCEFNTLYTFSTVNYVDIPAASIPGDLPARCLISVQNATNDVAIDPSNQTPMIMVAKSTKETSLPSGGNNVPQYNTIPFSAGTMQHADATLVVDNVLGNAHTPASASKKRLNVSFTATNTERYVANWAIGGAGLPHINNYLFRGTYAIFVRACCNAATSNMNMRLELRTGDTSAPIVLYDTGNVPVQGSASGWPVLTYMGTFRIPALPHAWVNVDGTGLQISSQIIPQFYATRTSATANQLYASDIIFVPIDEGAFYITTSDTYANTNLTTFFDNTGYFLHGKPEAIGGVVVPSGNKVITSQLSGNEITLTPGVNNRLYFVLVDPGFTPVGSVAGQSLNVFVNIVPRWSGVRDA